MNARKAEGQSFTPERLDDLRREWLRHEDALMRVCTSEQRHSLTWTVLSIRKALFGSIEKPSYRDVLEQFWKEKGI